jgi:hypothetical protein
MRLKIILGLLILALIMVFAACDNEMDIVYLEDGSQGFAGDGKVYGLESGAMYLVRNGIKWFPVRSDGTLGRQLEQLNYPMLNRAIADGDLVRLDNDITEITGLANGSIISVFKFGRPDRNWYLIPWSTIHRGNDQFVTNQRNMVIDLSLPSFRNTHTLTFTGEAMGRDTILIFVTPDLINVPQRFSVTSNPPNVIGGAEWHFSFGNLNYNSENGPMRLEVSDKPGQRGFFTITGSQPNSLDKLTKRGSGDQDRPPSGT